MEIIDKSFKRVPKSFIIQNTKFTGCAIVGHAWSYQVMIFVLIFATGLAIMRGLLGSRLRDLV